MAMDRQHTAAAAAHLKQRIVARWAHRHLGSLEHERRVGDIAGTLFTLTAPRHELTSYHRRLLALAATVHDVGRCDGEGGHEIAGAKMILRDDALPLTPSERRALAYLTRYHRGDVPDAGRDRMLRDGDDHAALRLTLALLRAADALDSRSLASPRLVFALRGRTLRIACYLDDDCAKARKAYGRRKKFRLLEELLNCRVEIDVRYAEALSMVA
jgi:exopolyphosphatase / guanosine-5'-triphosphate,3'-diphosphate pyrophosphatase